MRKFLVAVLAVLAVVPLIAEESAEFYYDRGNEYYKAGDVDSAIEDWTEAIRIMPDYLLSYIHRGFAYYAKRELDQAINDLSESIALEPNIPIVWNGRGSAYYVKGELEQAIEDFSRAIVLDPQYATAYTNRGISLRDKGEYSKAIVDFSVAIALEPDNFTAWVSRGHVFSLIGNTDRAIEDYSKCISINQNEASVWDSRGLLFLSYGELDRAIEDFSKAIALDLIHAAYWNNRGYAFYSKGLLDQAIEDYSKAIGLSPNNAEFWNNRGIAYGSNRMYEKAIEDLNQAIILNPKYALAWNNRGYIYSELGEIERAIYDYSKTISINPNHPAAWNNRGLAYRKKGESEKAIKDFNNVITLNPENNTAWYNRGISYYLMGELDMAIQDLRQSIDVINRSGNNLDIFYISWQFAGSVYERYPYLKKNRAFFSINEIKFYFNESDNYTEQYTSLAREALALSIAKAESVRSSLGSRGAEIMNSLVYQYYAGVDFEVTFGPEETAKKTAFAYSEGLRSRGFLEQMSTEKALRLPGIDPADAQRVGDLLRDIGNYQNLLSRINPQTETKRYAQAGAALTDAENALAAIEDRIAVEVPHYKALRKPQTASLEEAQAFCGEGRAILEYVIWPKSDPEAEERDPSLKFKAPSTSYGQSEYKNRPSINSYCLVITKDNIEAVRLEPDSKFDYAGKVDSLRKNLFRITGSRIIPNHESVFEAERNALYNALIKPILDKGLLPPNIKNILIVPDSNLSFIPFDILRENNKPGTRSLGEIYSITLSPSVSVSVNAAQNEITQIEPIIAFGGAWYDPQPDKNNPTKWKRDVNNNRLAALEKRMEEYRGNSGEGPREKERAIDYFKKRGGWDYLAGSIAEVQGLEKITAAAPRIIQGKDVSERRVKELSQDGALLNYPVIHFACHGFFNDNLTPQAALVFSEVSGLLKDESDEDGYLAIDEIALLQLKAKMVMLSACETGLNQNKRGDGMSGLARAFMVAGAQNVGVSLWEISDEATVEFMWRVYRKVIHEGKSFREAYSETKAEFRSGLANSESRFNEDWSHPYYWAAFTMYE